MPGPGPPLLFSVFVFSLLPASSEAPGLALTERSTPLAPGTWFHKMSRACAHARLGLKSTFALRSNALAMSDLLPGVDACWDRSDDTPKPADAVPASHVVDSTDGVSRDQSARARLNALSLKYKETELWEPCHDTPRQMTRSSHTVVHPLRNGNGLLRGCTVSSCRCTGFCDAAGALAHQTGGAPQIASSTYSAWRASSAVGCTHRCKRPTAWPRRSLVDVGPCVGQRCWCLPSGHG